MFFLGISAHLFIYLLVPAFVIVCFYFRGVTGNPEVSPLLPETIVYEQCCHSISKETYIYQVEKKKECSSLKCTFYAIDEIIAEIPFFQCNFYLSPVLSDKLLRAPPSAIFIF